MSAIIHVVYERKRSFNWLIVTEIRTAWMDLRNAGLNSAGSLSFFKRLCL